MYPWWTLTGLGMPELGYAGRLFCVELHKTGRHGRAKWCTYLRREADITE